MKRYEKYKFTDIDWIDEMPENWRMLKLNLLASTKFSSVDRHEFDNEIKVNVCHYPQAYNNERINRQTPLSVGTCSEKELENFFLRKGNVIITKDSETADDIGIPTYVEEDIPNSVCGYHLAILEPTYSEFEGAFLFRYLQSNNVSYYFEQNSNGVTRFGLGKATIENLTVPLPSLAEQTQIVRFLDYQTGIIDTIIAKKQKLIELLKEKRQSVINETVTRGLNPNAPMKDSGVEWLGEVPVHWKVVKLKHLSNVISKGTTPSTEGKELVDAGIRFLKAENIKDARVSELPEFFIDEETNEILKRSQLCENDLLFVIAGATLGKVAILPKKLLPANTNQAVAFIRLKEGANHSFVYYWLQSSILSEQIWLEAVQSAQPNLSLESLGNFQVPQPPMEEQQLIVNFIETRFVVLNRLLKENQQSIEKLKEYRQSLISEAVTGKIDVRDWEPPTA